jgi:hypothetical protein
MARSVGDHEVLLVVVGGAARPVVAAVEQPRAVEERELVVHVRLGLVDPHLDARAAQRLDVRALVHGLVVVADDPDRHAPAPGVEHGSPDAVVGDGEHAHVDLPVARANSSRIASRQSSPGLKATWTASLGASLGAGFGAGASSRARSASVSTQEKVSRMRVVGEGRARQHDGLRAEERDGVGVHGALVKYALDGGARRRRDAGVVEGLVEKRLELACTHRDGVLRPLGRGLYSGVGSL